MNMKGMMSDVMEVYRDTVSWMGCVEYVGGRCIEVKDNR